MQLRGLGNPASGEVTITGRDLFHRTPFRLGGTVAAVLAAAGVAVNDIWQMRTGRRRSVGVNVRHAAATPRS